VIDDESDNTEQHPGTSNQAVSQGEERNYLLLAGSGLRPVGCCPTASCPDGVSFVSLVMKSSRKAGCDMWSLKSCGAQRTTPLE
jgi:hypothetical protein